MGYGRHYSPAYHCCYPPSPPRLRATYLRTMRHFRFGRIPRFALRSEHAVGAMVAWRGEHWRARALKHADKLVPAWTRSPSQTPAARARSKWRRWFDISPGVYYARAPYRLLSYGITCRPRALCLPPRYLLLPALLLACRSARSLRASNSLSGQHVPLPRLRAAPAKPPPLTAATSDLPLLNSISSAPCALRSLTGHGR